MLKFNISSAWPLAGRALGLLLLCCFLSFNSQGQELIPLGVNEHKVVHLFFTEKVVYCESGTKDVNYTVTDNMIKLTAGKALFPETNLTVITEEGKLYGFMLQYNKDPKKLYLQPDDKSSLQLKLKPNAGLLTASASTAAASTAAVSSGTVSTGANAVNSSKIVPDAPVGFPQGPVEKEQELLSSCKKIMGNWKFTQFTKQKKNAELQLRNVFVDGNYIYFTVFAQNATEKELLIDFVNFQQGERKGILRRVYREELKKPVYVYNKTDKLEAKSQLHMVYVFEKFSIEEGKKLLIELGEKSGKRFFSLPVSAKYINEADDISLTSSTK